MPTLDTRPHSRRIVDTFLDADAPIDPVDLPSMTVTFATDARPDRDSPATVHAAKLLARTVDHLRVAHTDAQHRLVPHAGARIDVLLERAGLTPDQVAKFGDLISHELRLLLSEYDTHARATLHRRMAVDIAATLIPILEGK